MKIAFVLIKSMPKYILGLRLKHLAESAMTEMSIQIAHDCYRTGNYDQAATICQTLLASSPRDHHSLNLLAMIAIKRRDYPQGIRFLDQSIAAVPNQAQALFNRGYAKNQLRNFDNAIKDLQRATQLKKDYANAHFELAKALASLHRFDQAITEYNEVLRIQANHVEALNNKGNLLKRLDRTLEALACYDDAIALRPDFAEAHNNRGKALKDLGRFQEALDAYDQAIAHRPDYAMALTNKSLLLLLLGEMSSGWALFEWRWQSSKANKKRTFDKPLWLGKQAIAAKRLLIWGEQGFGDLIQFSRFLPLLEKLGCLPIIEVPATLIPLLETLAVPCEIIEKGCKPSADFDYHCPLMSLPLALDITLNSIPPPASFQIPADRKTKWHEILGEKKRPRIGLAWSGSPTHGNDRNRSLSLRQLAPLFSLPAEIHSLQKEIRADDLTFLSTVPIFRHEQEIADFADTAALVAEMDLVVSVDTSVAHLAGSIGKETWILLPFVPDYRWLLNQEDSPWYPAVRLFRQPAQNDWPTAISSLLSAFATRQNQGSSN